MLGLGGWDWAALALFFLLILVIGLWTSRKITNSSDFFLGGRRFGKVMMIFFSFGAGTSGNDAVGVSAKSYTSGLSGIWYQWLWLFCTPFYWLIAPAFRRMRALTTGDYFEQRYDGSVASLYAFVGILVLTVNIGVIQLGAASMVEAATGGMIPRTVGILGMAALYVAYGMAGGLAAAIITDFIQGILTLILSFILLPPVLKMVGGFSGLHSGIADESMFSLVAPGEINLFFIIMLCLNALIGVVTQPHHMGVCGAGRTELEGQIGFTGGNILKRICTIAWVLVGLCAIVLFKNSGQTVEPDLVYGAVAQQLLPQIMPGLIGLFLAALMASMMSSCDAFMVSSAGLFTQNVYKRWLQRDREEEHYVRVGRLSSLVVVCISLVFSFVVTDVPTGLLWFFKLQALMGAAFWLGLFWRRATVAGAWAATVAGFVVLFVTSLPAFQAWAVESLPEYMLFDGKFRDSWQIAAYLSAAFSVGILVSLCTRRVASEKLERFYNCLRTPVQAEEMLASEAFTIPEGVEIPPARKLINHPDLEIPFPSRQAVVGFVVVWLGVGALIGFVFWMAGWGA